MTYSFDPSNQDNRLSTTRSSVSRRRLLKRLGVATATLTLASGLQACSPPGDAQASGRQTQDMRVTPSEKPSGKNIVLVHGAFVDASSWSDVTPLLQQASMVTQDSLVKANGRILASTPFATIIGPFLAALLLAVTSLQAVLWCDALTFVVSAISLALVKTSFNAVAPQTRPKTSLRRDILDGLRYVLAQPVVRTLALFALLANLAVAVLYPQIVFYAKEVVVASDAQVGLFFTAAGMGAAVFMRSAGFLQKRLSYGMILRGSILLSGLSVLALIATRLYWVDLVCFGVLFGLIGLFNVAFNSILQAITPHQLLGRVLTFTIVLAVFSVPFSSILGGLVIDQVNNVVLVFAILGVFLVFLALVFVWSPLTRIEGYLPPAQPVDAPQGTPSHDVGHGRAVDRTKKEAGE